jgi:FkbM family methyltransferase
VNPGPRDAVLHSFQIDGNRIQVYDLSGSRAAAYIADELASDCYGLRCLRLLPGDCVLDIGGHIGLFAILLAKRYPGVRIFSYEPHPRNFALFRRNLELNGIDCVTLYPEAVSCDGRLITLAGNPANSGAPTAHSRTLGHARVAGVPSLTLDQMLDRECMERCSLLKIDCEGSEYEALTAAHGWGRVERLCGEFHSNRLLRSRGHSPERLLEYCQDRLGVDNVRVSHCGMSE